MSYFTSNHQAEFENQQHKRLADHIEKQIKFAQILPEIYKKLEKQTLSAEYIDLKNKLKDVITDTLSKKPVNSAQKLALLFVDIQPDFTIKGAREGGGALYVLDGENTILSNMALLDAVAELASQNSRLADELDLIHTYDVHKLGRHIDDDSEEVKQLIVAHGRDRAKEIFETEQKELWPMAVGHSKLFKEKDLFSQEDVRFEHQDSFVWTGCKLYYVRFDGFLAEVPLRAGLTLDKTLFVGFPKTEQTSIELTPEDIEKFFMTDAGAYRRGADQYGLHCHEGTVGARMVTPIKTRKDALVEKYHFKDDQYGKSNVSGPASALLMKKDAVIEDPEHLKGGTTIYENPPQTLNSNFENKYYWIFGVGICGNVCVEAALLDLRSWVGEKTVVAVLDPCVHYLVRPTLPYDTARGLTLNKYKGAGIVEIRIPGHRSNPKEESIRYCY